MEQKILDISRKQSTDERSLKSFLRGEKLPRKKKKKAKALLVLAKEFTDKNFIQISQIKLNE